MPDSSGQARAFAEQKENSSCSTPDSRVKPGRLLIAASVISKDVVQRLVCLNQEMLSRKDAELAARFERICKEFIRENDLGKDFRAEYELCKQELMSDQLDKINAIEKSRRAVESQVLFAFVSFKASLYFQKSTTWQS